MKIVRYVPLVNHLTRQFTAATPVGPRLATPLGAAVAAQKVAPETPVGPRPAIVVDYPAAGTADLFVFKKPSDPYRSAVPETGQFVGGVPYSRNAEPGTFHFEEDAPEQPEFVPAAKPFSEVLAPAAVAVDGGAVVAFEDMTIAQLQSYAKSHDIALGSATKQADIAAAIRAAAVAA